LTVFSIPEYTTGAIHEESPATVVRRPMFSPIPLIQRYVFGELTRAFLFVLSAVTVLTIFAGVIQQAMEKGLSIEHTLLILPYVIPSMMPFTIPAALLMTVCLVYGRLSGDHEVTAAKAAGISVMSLLWPSLILGGFLSVVSLFLTDQVIPWAETQIERTIVRAMEDILFEKLRSQNGFKDPKHGIIITVAGIDEHDLIRPVIQMRKKSKGDEPESWTTIRAETATIHLQPKIRKVQVTLKNWYGTLPGNQSLRNRDKLSLTFPWDGDARKPKARYLAVTQIDEEMATVARETARTQDRQTIESLFALTLGDFDALAAPSSTSKSLKERTGWYHKLHTEKHSRYALACSCFFFALLGGPFAVWQGKNQFLTSFLFCFGPIVAVYYPLVLGMMTQAKKGNIDPLIGMWLGNLVLGVVAVWVLRRVVKY
jgi:lipopolysaccharide export system permease protein